MQPDLRTLIHATHGDNGQCAFARGLGRNARTIRKWLAKGLSAERYAECVAYARRRGVEVEDVCPTCGQKRAEGALERSTPTLSPTQEGLRDD
jgi:hypothetical protein